MNAAELAELPGLVKLESMRLRRVQGFGLVVVLAPSRGALQDARGRLKGLIPERVEGTLEGLDEHGWVWQALDHPTWAQRRVRLGELNLSRDVLHRRGVLLILGLLDEDFPRFAQTAPDLFTVRIAVLRHDAASPFGDIAPKPLDLTPVARVPEPLLELSNELPLRILRLEPRGQGTLRTISMEDLFVEVELAGPMPDNPPQGFEPTVGQALALLTRYPVVRLEGAAGSGKTTLLRRYARERARAGVDVLLVNLPDLVEPLPGPGELVEAVARLRAACLWPLPDEARPLLLLDGLDELGDPEQRERAVLLADDLVRTKFVSGAVIAGRPSHRPVDPEADAAAAFRAVDAVRSLVVQDLTPEGMKGYLQRWVNKACGVSERKTQLARLNKALGLEGGEQTPSAERLRALCTRPLFLSVLCALVWGRGREPEGEVELLDALVDALIAGRSLRGLRSSDLRWLAGRLAWAARTRHRQSLTLAEATCGPEAVLTPEQLELVRLNTGLLQQDPQHVRFSHAALRDLLVAERALDELRPGQDDDSLWRFLGLRRLRAPAGDPASTLAWGLGGLTPEGRLLLELLGRSRPMTLKALLDPWSDTVLARVFIEVWGGQPPLALFGLHERTVASFRGRVRAPTEPLFRRCTIAEQLIGLRGDSIGGLEWVDVADGWALARWPVTVEQLQTFIEDGGYKDLELWSDKGRAWLKKPARSRRKDRPDRWGDPDTTRPGRPALGLSHHEAAAFVRWMQRRLGDPRVALPPAEVWKREARTCPHWSAAQALEALRGDPHVPWWRGRFLPAVGVMPELASASGVEDLGCLVREWLEPSRQVPEHFAGHAWTEPGAPLQGSIKQRAGGGRRWSHVHGLRLSRRPAGRPSGS